MATKKENSLDKLFGSKTRTKLLELFFTNTDKSFYVREITRLIEEQVNSVRRELSNLLALGVVKSDTYDNKLYYTVSKEYPHFGALKEMFTGVKCQAQERIQKHSESIWELAVKPVRHLVEALLVVNSTTSTRPPIDLLVVGNDSNKQLSKWASSAEKKQGRSLNYVILPREDFYYRMSIKDKFLNDILSLDFTVIIDDNSIIKSGAKKDV